MAAEPQAEPAASVPWSLRLSAGFGVGTRDFDLPKDGVIYQTTTGAFPAAELGFELDHLVSDDILVGLLVRYQSSVGLRIVEQLTDGSEHPRDTRSHGLELAIAPTFRFDSQGHWALSMPIGYAISDFHPEGHLETPSYFLAGPYVRAELQIVLWERLRLRLGPEAQWIAQVGHELIDRGAATSGLGAGGTAAVGVVLSRRWMVEAAYRQLHCWLDWSQSGSLKDVTRFITARLSGTL